MTPPDTGAERESQAEIPPLRELYDVLPENWEELYEQGYRYALNIEVGGLSPAEHGDLLDFLKEQLFRGREDELLVGFPFDEASGRPLEHRWSQVLSF